MKFRLLSDLHLEFRADTRIPLHIPEMDDDKKTIMLLAGDIHVGLKAEEFIRHLCDRFMFVAYALGNHEFYHNTYNRVRDDWAALEKKMPANFRLIDDTEFTYQEYRILGGTLWTDFQKQDYWAMVHAKRGMNDFACTKFIEGDRLRNLLPIDTARIHEKTLAFIGEQLKKPWDGRTVVMTHHLPHPLCVPDRFRNDPLNAAYMTNLDNFIYDHEIDVWAHGHTHDVVDFTIHGTRIICNPGGYHPHAINPDFNPRFTFEL